jgi:adenylate cyclase
MSLIAELKRRNVFRVGAAYAIVAWLLIEVASVILPALHLPDWALTLLVVFVVAGFPLALIVAWAFEMTPQGIKRETAVDPDESITRNTGRKLDFAIIGLLAIAVVYFAVDKFVLDAETGQAEVAAEQVPTAEPVAQEKSIAVLPFANMSEDANNEFFADGISEELLNLLAKIPELRVIARTSSFAFKGKEVDIADIANKLNVAHVLEGSVRKSGNQVRITAQLIRTADSTHLWSEIYDRTLDDIFMVQEEIAATVVEQLKLTLLGEAPHIITTDPEAYTQVLQANYLVSRSTAEDYERAVVLYQRALKIDPAYPLAWVGLTSVYSNQVHAGFRPPADGARLARDAARQADALNPNLASVQRALAYVAMTFDQDLSATARHLTRGLELDPRDIDLLSDATLFLAYLGRQQPSIALGQHAVARDPEDPRTHFALALAYFVAGRWDESIRTNRTSSQAESRFCVGAALHRCGVAVPG